MSEHSVRIKSNWNVLNGNQWTNALICHEQSPESSQNVEREPELDEIVDEDRVVIVGTDNQLTPYSCEINLKTYPKLKFRSCTLISDCDKLELFLGKDCEYKDMLYGTLEDDFEGVQVYRFNVRVGDELVTDLTLKLLPKTNQICIFGLHVNLLPNPNGLHNVLLPTNINLENVQNMLANSNQKLSPNAEKCKAFLQTYMKMGASNNIINSNMPPFLLSQLGGMQNMSAFSDVLSKKLTLNNGNEGEVVDIVETEQILDNAQGEDKRNHSKHEISNDLKTYVSEEISKLEDRIMHKLNSIEEQQNKRFDEVLNCVHNSMLEKLTIVEERQNKKMDAIFELLGKSPAKEERKDLDLKVEIQNKKLDAILELLQNTSKN